MSDSVYSVIAYIARYWFIFLAIIIVWRAIVWTRKDSARVSRVQRSLPDAGFIGEWAVVASDVSAIPAGKVLRAPRDGWIGSARGCDVRLQNAGVPAKAARFFLRSDGLHVQPQRRDILLVDGESVSREAVMRHGATLTVGGVTLQLRLFAGVLLEGEAPSPMTMPFQVIRGGRRKKQAAPDYEENLEYDDESYDEYDEDNTYEETDDESYGDEDVEYDEDYDEYDD